MFGNMNAGRGIGCPRPARHHGDTGASRQTGCGIRHHGGAALLATNRDLDRGIMQRIEHGQIALARHTKHMFNTLGCQRIDD